MAIYESNKWWEEELKSNTFRCVICERTHDFTERVMSNTFGISLITCRRCIRILQGPLQPYELKAIQHLLDGKEY